MLARWMSVNARADRLHVLILIDSLRTGGAEMLLSDFASGARESGLTVSVASLTGFEGSPAAERLRREGVDPVEIDMRGLVSPQSLRSVRRHIRRTAPDLVHTHLDYADALGGLAARSLGIPSLSTVHVMRWQSEGARDRLRHRLLRVARRRSAKVIVAVSEASRDAMIAARIGPPEAIVTIRNGVEAVPDPGGGRRVRAELGIGPEERVVSHISVLRAGKGHELTAAATARLLERGLDARLLLVGDGPDREAIERRFEPLGSRALALGHRDDVMAVLDASDVVIAPSHFDAFPTVLLEAMAAAVPIVATAVGGIPEIVVDGETGLLIEPSAEGLATALAGVLGDPELRSRFGRAARERYEREFTAARWAGRMETLYRDILREGGA